MTVPMMSRTSDFRHARLEAEHAQIVELPYVGGGTSMVVILPDYDAPGGLAELEGLLGPERLAAWIDAMSVGRVTMGLPS